MKPKFSISPDRVCLSFEAIAERGGTDVGGGHALSAGRARHTHTPRKIAERARLACDCLFRRRCRIRDGDGGGGGGDSVAWPTRARFDTTAFCR